MTAVGKILVFFNLIFSLAVGAFAVLDYTARTHWAEDHKKLSARIQVAESASATYRAEAERLTKDRQELNEKLTTLAGKNAGIKGTEDVEVAARKVAKALDDALTAQDEFTFKGRQRL